MDFNFPLGYIWQEDDPRDFQFTPMRAMMASAPSKKILDLPGRMIQGPLGSCGPCSLDEVFMYLMKVQDMTVEHSSVLFTYYVTRSLQGTVNVDSGVNNRAMLKAVNKSGYCEATYWPYVPQRFRQKPPDEAFADAAQSPITNYAAVRQDLEHMRGTIASGIPILFGFDVFPAAQTEAVAKSGILPMPARGESPLGGHDVVLFGYDDARQSFAATNHWEGWGIEINGVPGSFWIPYDYATSSDLSGDFWVVNALPIPPRPQPSPQPSPQPQPAPQPSRKTITLSGFGSDDGVYVKEFRFN